MFLGIPQRTLRLWFDGNTPLLKPSGEVHGFPLLSFADAVEAHALHLLRSHHHVPMQSIKRAVERLPRYTSVKRPLLSDDLRVLDKDILLERRAHGKQPRHIVNLSQDGQLVIEHVADIFSKRVLRDSSGKVISIFPWRYWNEDEESKPVEIDPEVMSGRLVILATRIPVTMIQNRKLRGQTTQSIADDYSISLERVEKALRHIDTKAA